MILSDPQSHFKMNTRYQKVVTKFRIQQQYKRAYDRRRMPSLSYGHNTGMTLVRGIHAMISSFIPHTTAFSFAPWRLKMLCLSYAAS